MERKSTRLWFSKEELDHAPVRKAADKAEKAANRADKAKARLPGEQSVVTKGSKKLRHEDDKSTQRQAQLRFGKKEEKEKTVAGSEKLKGKSESKLRHSVSASEKAFGVKASDKAVYAKKKTAKNAKTSDAGKNTAAKKVVSSGKETASGKNPPISSKLKEETDAAKAVKQHLKFPAENEVLKDPHLTGRGVKKTAGVAASAVIHAKISQSNEDDNVSVDAMQAASEAAEGSARLTSEVGYSKKMKDYEKAVRLDQKSHKANLDALFEADKSKNPEKYSNPISRWQQKRQIKKEYEAARAAANSRNFAEGTGAAAGTAKRTASTGQNLIEKLKYYAVEHSGFIKFLLLALLILMLVVTVLQSCSTMFTGALTTVTATSWPADDIEISKAEAYYVKLECELRKKIDKIPDTHSGSDEYNYEIADIGHDPSVLISYLCAKYGGFKFSDIKSDIEDLFNLQYNLSISERNENRTPDSDVKITDVKLTSKDLETVCNSLMSEEEKKMYDMYQMTHGNRMFFGTPVPYNWHENILCHYGYYYDAVNMTVEDSDEMILSLPEGVQVMSVMDGTVKSVSADKVVLVDEHDYEIILSGLKNISVSKNDTVESGQSIAKVSSGLKLSIRFKYRGTYYNPYFYMDTGTAVIASPGIASDKAAALINEAKKYLGTPYVWGGYSPSGFDCSGYVSYCLTHSGVKNTGHLTANGLLAQCRRISKDQLQPGDLVFFQGTYETSGASHVGIFIGSGQYGSATFIHCGDPCQYGNLNSSYWIEHWLTGGRILD